MAQRHERIYKGLDKGLPKEETPRNSEIDGTTGGAGWEKLACAEGEENMIHSSGGRRCT